MKYCDSCSKNSNDFSDMQGFRRHLKSNEGGISDIVNSMAFLNTKVLNTKSILLTPKINIVTPLKTSTPPLTPPSIPKSQIKATPKSQNHTPNSSNYAAD